MKKDSLNSWVKSGTPWIWMNAGAVSIAVIMTLGLLAIIAGMRHADPDLTLAGIAKRLEDMRERTPRGSAKWYPSSVRALLLRAEKMGLIAAQPTLPLSERPG